MVVAPPLAGLVGLFLALPQGMNSILWLAALAAVAWAATSIQLIRKLANSKESLSHESTTARTISSDEKYRQLFQASPDYILIARTSDGMVIDVNEGFEKLTGYSEAEAVGRTMRDLNVWAIPSERTEYIELLLREGRVRGFPTHLRRRDGEIRNCVASCAMVYIDGVSHSVSVVRDVTEELTTQRRLAESEAHFRALFDGAPIAIMEYELDASNRLILQSANRGALETTGLDLPWMIGRPIEEVFPGLAGGVIPQAYTQVALTGVPFSRESTDYVDNRIMGSFESFASQVAPRRVAAFVRNVTERKKASEALRIAQEQLSAAFQVSPDAMSITAMSDGKLVEINQAFERATGYSREEALGKTVIELGVWRNDYDRAELLATLQRDGILHNIPYIQGEKSGKTRETQLNCAVFEANNERYLVSLLHDLTDIKRADRELHESEARLRTLFEVSPTGIIMMNDKGHITLCNQRMTDMLGYQPGELMGRTYPELMHPDSLTAAKNGVRKLFSSPAGKLVSAERKFLRADGSFTWGLVTIRRVSDEDFGSRGSVATITDISELKKAEADRIASEARFAELFQSSPVALAVHQVGGKYLGLNFNEAWFRTFLYAPEQALQHSSLEIGLWADPAQRSEFLQQLERDQGVREYSALMRRADGMLRQCLLSVRRVGEGPLAVWLTSYQDITDQQRIQQEIITLNTQLEARVGERTKALQDANSELFETLNSLKTTQSELIKSEKLAALGSLVAGVAHELNTPLGNSLTVASTMDHKLEEFTKVMASGLKRSVLEQFVSDSRAGTDILLRNLTRASELVLSFKQVAVDQTSSHRRRFALDTVVSEILITLNPVIRKSPCKISTHVAEGIWFDSYPGPLGQVLTNLVNNAMIHGFEPGTAGHIDITATVLNANQVELRVRDDGQGISAENLTRIFDPFFTTRLGQGGSGLGLHIVHNIVTGMLGGEIEVHSAVNDGTTFVLTLPLTPSSTNTGSIPLAD